MKLNSIKLMRPIYFNGHQNDGFPNRNNEQCKIEILDNIIIITDLTNIVSCITSVSNLLYAQPITEVIVPEPVVKEKKYGRK